MEKIPDSLQDDTIFQKLFRIAEIANLPKNEINNYFLSLNKQKNMDFIIEEKNRKIEEQGNTIIEQGQTILEQGNTIQKQGNTIVMLQANFSTLQAKDEEKSQSILLLQTQLAELQKKMGIN